MGICSVPFPVRNDLDAPSHAIDFTMRSVSIIIEVTRGLNKTVYQEWAGSGVAAFVLCERL